MLGHAHATKLWEMGQEAKALVKSLMTLHQGSFTIESIEGQGTTVTVDFPVAAQECIAA